MIAVVIPARLGSTRLPNKLILTDTGKPLLYHTLDRVLESKLSGLIFVATDSKEIYGLVECYNNVKVRPILTGPANSGTERIAKFISTYFIDDEHVVVNFQGDEPDLPGHFIDRLAEAVGSGFSDVATLASPASQDEAYNPDVVKTVLDHGGNALWFSRHAIPMGGPWLKHVGIYAYKAKFLRRLFTMTPGTANGERLEQLQWLQAGYKIRVLVDDVESVGIDNHDDYAAFVARHKGQVPCRLSLATS